MEALQILQALLRRKWLIVESVAFFLIAATVITLLLPKRYEATSKLIVESSDTTSSILSDLGLEEMALSMSSSSDEMQNEITLATMRPVLEGVVWDLQLRDSDGKLILPEKLITSSLIEDLLAAPKVSVTQAQGTSILMITSTSDDPDLSRLMADAVALSYIEVTKERARHEVHEAGHFVKEQVVKVQSELDAALGEIADAQLAEEVLDLDSEVKAAVSMVSEMMLEYETSLGAIESLRAQINHEETRQDREGIEMLRSATMSENNQIRSVRENLGQLRQLREAELLEKTSQHPDVILLDRQITAAQEELQRALDEQHQGSLAMEELTSRLVAEEEKAKETDAAIRRVTAEFSAYPSKMRRLSQLQLAAEAAEKLFISLQEQSYQIAIAEALTVSDLKFVEYAKSPEKHSSPKLIINIVAGLMVGLMCGFALVFAFEYLDDSIKTPDELRQAWNVTQLGTIPRFGRKDEPRLIVDVPAHDPVAEAYRTVRNSIAYATLDKPPRFLALTSSIPGEGKSTVSVNLAISMARDGKRVVIIDADFRRPTQHRFWTHTNNHVGVTSVLLGEVELADAMQDLAVPNLRLLAAGPLPPDPGRLVESLKMRQLLMDVSRTCDIVIVDTPPIMVVNDAVILGRQVDQLIVVTEAGKASRKTMSDLAERLETSGLQILGVILNKLDTASSYGGYYRYYRDHYAPGDPKHGSKRKRRSTEKPSGDESGSAPQGGVA